MENTTALRHNRRRSGYEPSDTETDWLDSPRKHPFENQNRNNNNSNNNSPLKILDAPISVSARRKHVKSPYKPRLENGNGIGIGIGIGIGNVFPHSNNNTSDLRRNISPLPHRTYSDIRENISPFSRSERRTTNPDSINGGNVCPFSQSERRINPDNNNNNNRENVTSPFATSERRRRVSPFDTSYYSRRAASAPRAKQMPQEDIRDLTTQTRFPLVGEINEMVANAKISSNFESTESISPGDIFFSRDYNGASKNGGNGSNRSLPKPPGYVDRNQGFNRNSNSSSGVSRQSSNVSELSGRTSASTRKFVENRRKGQKDATWFSCIKDGSCKTSRKSPEKDRPFDEASFIGKAIVVESLRPFWADKYQPASLTSFTCHKQEAMLLQQLATSKIFPHILLKGSPGSGKKTLTMALLREIYGDPVWNISRDLRYFHIMKESRPMQVVVPISSSPHHVELNVYLEPKSAYALTAIVKQISTEFAVTPEISTVNATKADFKVLVLYDVDKAAENIQHLIKWIMDCYSDSCKLILCCEDDVDLLDSVKNRCKVIEIEAPITHQVMEVLIQIAKKEGFELSMSFAAKIATKSKQNLRRAIMALEACKAHNYPFSEDQPIPLGWEDALVELASDILADPLPKRLFIVRGKIQKLLADFVHPKLVLQKLVEQLLRGIEASLKRELYYWYAYYDKRLPVGTSALLKLEEFVAKFMSIYRKSSSNRQFS